MHTNYILLVSTYIDPSLAEKPMETASKGVCRKTYTHSVDLQSNSRSNSIAININEGMTPGRLMMALKCLVKVSTTNHGVGIWWSLIFQVDLISS